LHLHTKNTIRLCPKGVDSSSGMLTNERQKYRLVVRVYWRRHDPDCLTGSGAPMSAEVPDCITRWDQVRWGPSAGPLFIEGRLGLHLVTLPLPIRQKQRDGSSPLLRLDRVWRWFPRCHQGDLLVQNPQAGLPHIWRSQAACSKTPHPIPCPCSPITPLSQPHTAAEGLIAGLWDCDVRGA